MLFLLLWACDGSDIVAVIPCKTPLVYYGTHLVNLWAMKVISLGLWCLQSPFCTCSWSWCLNLVYLALASLSYGQVQPLFVVDDLLCVAFFRMRSASSSYTGTWKLHCSIWLFCIALYYYFFSERLHSIISHCFQNRSCASCTFFEQSIFILGYDFTVSTTVAAMIPWSYVCMALCFSVLSGSICHCPRMWSALFVRNSSYQYILFV